MEKRKSYLSKTAFKVGRSCPTKLYYYLNRYPSTLDDDPYLELLSEGGFMVGKIAQLLYPEGILVDTSQGVEAAFLETKELLKRPNVTIFEATFIAGLKTISTDILVKRGESLQLIEVKSKSFDSNEDATKRAKNGLGLFWNAAGTGITSDWREYLEDVAYQMLVLEEFGPQFKISASLLMPDKARPTAIDELASQFKLERASSDSRDRRTNVIFSGDPEILRGQPLLTKIAADSEVRALMPEVSEAALTLVDSIKNKVSKIPPTIGKKCKDCEFRGGEGGEQDGFKECWGELADVKPHVFDLYYGGAIKKDGKFVVEELIDKKRVSLFDVPLEVLTGVRGKRQKIQIDYTRDNKEWIAPELTDFVAAVKYPLHFIDFETSRLAVPSHTGMRPFEQVAFQWSCHTIHAPGEAPKHKDWINVERTFPNFEFARSLMDAVGPDGSILVWATHENTTLTDIQDQIKRFGHKDPALDEWLSLVTKSSASQGRLVDMNKLTQDYYFHPKMAGRTSLKYVLPAIWGSNESLHELSWLKRYVKKSGSELLNPYETLPPIEICGVNQTVKEGTGAMTAYQEMLYGEVAKDPEMKGKWRELLRQYCELDTLAMVVVFRHWLGVSS